METQQQRCADCGKPVASADDWAWNAQHVCETPDCKAGSHLCWGAGSCTPMTLEALTDRLREIAGLDAGTNVFDALDVIRGAVNSAAYLRVQRGSFRRAMRVAVDAQAARARRAEAHLRECQALLRKIADVLPANEVSAKAAELAEPRTPASCGVKMSHYGTCRLGTYGCASRHDGEEQGGEP